MVYTLSPILSAPRRRSVVVTKLRVWTARLEDRRPAGSAALKGGDSVAIATVRRRRHFGTPRNACMRSDSQDRPDNSVFAYMMQGCADVSGTTPRGGGSPNDVSRGIGTGRRRRDAA